MLAKIWFWTQEAVKAVISFLERRGVDRRWFKSLLYFFVPLAAMVLLSAWNLGSPLKRAAAIMALAVLKQVVWDVLWHHNEFDWIDLAPTVVALLIGLMMTGLGIVSGLP